MSSPRSAAWMLERFGLTADSGDDERSLLINPATWRPNALDEPTFVECVMDRTELGVGVHRYGLSVVLNDDNEAYALGALQRVVNQNTTYELSLCEGEEDEFFSGDVHYTGKLSCNA